MEQPKLEAAHPRAQAYELDRRGFLKFAALMTATLALPKQYTAQIADALATATRPPVLWFQFQDCTGDTESFLRSTQPTVDSLLLSLLSVEYHETLMAPSGENAKKSMEDVVANYPGGYICIVEGAIPTGANGCYCVVGGETALSIANRIFPGALAVITVGSQRAAWIEVKVSRQGDGHIGHTVGPQRKDAIGSEINDTRGDQVVGSGGKAAEIHEGDGAAGHGDRGGRGDRHHRGRGQQDGGHAGARDG